MTDVHKDNICCKSIMYNAVLYTFLLLLVCEISDQQILYLEIGDTCDAGTCRILKDCPTALQDIREREFPQICSFNRLEPIVCCRHEQQLKFSTEDKKNITKQRISEKKCEEYSKIQIEREDYKIIGGGGVPALLFEFPHMALIGYGDVKNPVWKCGGSLISERYVLTAAHCLYAREYGPANTVRLGEIDISNTDEGPAVQDFEIEQIIQHPNFKPSNKSNDIALLRLNRDVIFRYVKPACLYADSEIHAKTGTAVGWGATSFGGEFSNELLKIYLDIYHAQNCSALYGTTYSIDENTQICAGTKDGSRDTCEGDSGGPLQISGQKTYVIGVVSFGRPCLLSKIPGVYTKVSSFVPWIESIVWK